ncbi:MAG: hypothetical protein QOH27_2187 [Mycobacterium sp.]|jgi:hypothetical protein|nr:hypothetical protein [Mycobacterium sp.]
MSNSIDEQQIVVAFGFLHQPARLGPATLLVRQLMIAEPLAQSHFE